MILKTSIIVIFNFIWLNIVSGASFSKVFVQSGAEVVPVEYIQYGAPAVSVAGSLAQISAAPVGSVVPFSSPSNYLPPCGTPCLYPGSSITSVQPAVPNYVTYKSSVPVVVASRDEATGYEYSYIVYDENTGDRKSQSEHSDGSVVRGEYSLLQPDGYVREVQYVADDVKGFNAIVKNFFPVNLENKVDHKEKTEHGQPCLETKNEPIKQVAHQESKSSEESHPNSSTESHNNSREESYGNSSQDGDGKSVDESRENSSKEQNTEDTSETIHAEKSYEKHSHEKPSTALIPHNSHMAKIEEESHKTKSSDEVQAEEPVSSEEHSESLSHDEHRTESSNENKDSHENHKEDSQEHKESHELHEEPSHEVHNASHEVHAEVEHEARANKYEPEGNLLVSYNDIIKCIQSATRKTNGLANSHQVESPLTYIILNKPC